MARGVNKVILIGNVGTEPDARYMPNGNAATTLSIATTEAWKDKQTGEKQERTEWHRVVCFNRLGEIAAEYVKKGTKLYIEGSLRTRKWQDQQGQERYTTEIIASDIQMLDNKTMQNQDAYRRDDRSAAPIYAKKDTAPSKENFSEPALHDGFEGLDDDDIPF